MITLKTVLSGGEGSKEEATAGLEGTENWAGSGTPEDRDRECRQTRGAGGTGAAAGAICHPSPEDSQPSGPFTPGDTEATPPSSPALGPFPRTSGLGEGLQPAFSFLVLVFIFGVLTWSGILFKKLYFHDLI